MLGERMIRSKLTDGTGAPYIEWKLQDLNLPIEENTTLSFWINIVESPGGADKIVVDGNTTMGRLKDNFNIFDQNGVMLNAKYRAPMPAGWQFVYADLSPLQGDSLLDIRLRYETTVAGEAGNLTAYLDDIRVEHHEGGEALNSSFEEDHDENGTPDFWTDIWGATETEGVLRSDDFAHEGSYSMLVYDGWCNGLGAQHIFHSNADIQVYGVAFQYMAPVPTSFRVRVIDANWEQELLNTTVAAGPAWTRFYGEFPNCDYGFGTGRVKIQILPQECEYPVYVDEMDIREWEGIGVRSVDPTPTVSRFASVSPNPAPRGSTLSVRFELTRASDVKVNVYDVAGRVAWEMPSREYPAGPQELIWSTQAQRLASGVYFLEMWVGGKRLSGTKKVVLLR
jgi:hypothetical protein